MSFLSFVADKDGLTLTDIVWRAASAEGVLPPGEMERRFPENPWADGESLYGSIARSLKADLVRLQQMDEATYQQFREEKLEAVKVANEELQSERKLHLARTKAAHAIVAAWDVPEAFEELQTQTLTTLQHRIGELTIEIEQPPTTLNVAPNRDTAIAEMSSKLDYYKALDRDAIEETAKLIERSKQLAEAIGVPAKS